MDFDDIESGNSDDGVYAYIDAPPDVVTDKFKEDVNLRGLKAKDVNSLLLAVRMDEYEYEYSDDDAVMGRVLNEVFEGLSDSFSQLCAALSSTSDEGNVEYIYENESYSDFAELCDYMGKECVMLALE